MLRLHLSHQRRHPDYRLSISASVAASLDENQTERTRSQIIVGLLVASIPLLLRRLLPRKRELEELIQAYQ